MAGTTATRTVKSLPGSAEYEIRLQLNKLIDDVELIRAAFMTHTHKTPTTNPGFTSVPNTDAGGSGSTGGTAITTVDVAADLLAAKIAGNDGSTTV